MCDSATHTGGRECQDQERVQLKSVDQIAVQQLVQPTCRAAAWTGKTGQYAKWTTRQESGLARLKYKKSNGADADGQPKHEHAQSSIEYVFHHHKLENYHDS